MIAEIAEIFNLTMENVFWIIGLIIYVALLVFFCYGGYVMADTRHYLSDNDED